MVCIDASVFVAFGRPSEANHETSIQFLSRLDEVEDGVVDPVLVQTECAGALARRTDDVEEALHFAEGLERLPGMHLVVINHSLAFRAAEIAATHRLRGADAVYVATAEAHDALLVTWDEEMLDRGSAVVETMTPGEWLEANIDTEGRS